MEIAVFVSGYKFISVCDCKYSLAGSAAADSAVLTVAASPAPHAEILTDFAVPLLAEQGIKLKVKELSLIHI